MQSAVVSAAATRPMALSTMLCSIFYSSPHINQTLLQIIHILHFFRQTSCWIIPGFLVNWIDVMAVQPQTWRDECRMHGGWLHSTLCTASFQILQTSRITVYAYATHYKTGKTFLSWYLACWIVGLWPAFLHHGHPSSVYSHFGMWLPPRYVFGRCFMFFSALLSVSPYFV